MTQPSRRTRPVPERTEPKRSWAQHLDPSAEANAGRAPEPSERPGAGSPPPLDGEPAFDAVSNAYRLIDDYLRQGQRFADSLWLPFQGDARGSQSFNPPGRLLRAMSDMTSAWFELLQQSAKSGDAGAEQAPVGTAGPFSFGGSPAAAAPATPEAQPSQKVHAPLGIRLRSSGAVEVAVELNPGCESSALVATELSSHSKQGEPISSVTVELGDGKAPVLAIDVPKAQPPGTYNGLLLDRATQRPCGIVSLTVLGEP